MANGGRIFLAGQQYGKAENRVLRVYRDTPRHEIRDLSVTTALRGDFAAAYVRGDQAQVLPTDSQKNTVFAYAKSAGVRAIEDFALTLGTHFVDDVDPVHGARVDVAEYGWDRVPVDGTGHDHTFVRRGQEVRTTGVTVEGSGAEQRHWVVSGLRDLVLLKSTGSAFRGFLVDEYTTLPETDDRVMATSLVARWRYAAAPPQGWDRCYDDVKRLLLETYATVFSHALQQTLWEMGKAVLERHETIAEVRLSAPNKHHFVVDLAPFGLANENEVFIASDRPFGLIEATVQREDAPDAGPAFDDLPASR